MHGHQDARNIYHFTVALNVMNDRGSDHIDFVENFHQSFLVLFRDFRSIGEISKDPLISSCEFF